MSNLPRFTKGDLPEHTNAGDVAANRYTEAALERHKREGVELATWARLIALGVIAVMLPFLNDTWDVLYFEAFLVLFALNGLAQRYVARVGRSFIEFGLMQVDLMMLTFMFCFPPPFWDPTWPDAMGLRFGNFMYFFVILAAGTLMYNWRTILAMGHWTAALWGLGVGLIWWLGRTYPELTAMMQERFGSEGLMLDLLDPNSVQFNQRVQEIVVFLIVAYTLALTVRRFNRLLLGNAVLERERANLSRYFSPNVVEELSQNDMSLRAVRQQDVAVLFVDLVGFTAYASKRSALEVIETLRAFHHRMETCVFAAEGTLDKYLGDGLMATFGTPEVREDDCLRALNCARAMLTEVVALNEERSASGKEPLRISIGLHVGPVVLGDIGANRLEYAVIGNTVNVASRMESLTRKLQARLVLSDQAYSELAERGAAVQDMSAVADQEIRGLHGTVRVWTLA